MTGSHVRRVQEPSPEASASPSTAESAADAVRTEVRPGLRNLRRSFAKSTPELCVLCLMGSLLTSNSVHRLFSS